jgi:hypothetical protein
MKRCQKCNRTYPDDNQKFCTFDGGLLAADQPFDPNVTIQSTSATAFTPPAAEKPTSRDLPDLNATIAASQSAPTEVFNKRTGPTGAATVFDQPVTPPPQHQSAPLPGVSQSAPLPPAAPAAVPKKKSKLPLVLGILALLLVLGVGAIVAAFFLVIKPRLDEMQPERTVVTTTNDNENTAANDNVNTAEVSKTTDEYVPPSDAVKFTNSQASLDGKLAEHYVDFSFYYPKTWTVDSRSGVTNFVKIGKTEEDEKGVYLLENASVNWYNSNGTFDADASIFPDRVKQMESQIASSYPGYQKVSEGETRINSLKAYEFRFTGTFKNTDKGDLPYWGRVIFVPAGEGKTSGAVITLLATSLAQDISRAEDVGEKGEMPVILESFRFGNNR